MYLSIHSDLHLEHKNIEEINNLNIQYELNANNEIKLKEGDIVSVTVKNTNKTISQLLRNFFYRVSGNDTYQISAQHGGIVMVNAN